MTKLRKKLTEKTRKFGAEVSRRHSTGLTPESEECYERVPASFPPDWYDLSGPGCDGLKLKKEAPERAHKELRKWNIYRDRKARKGIIVD